VEGALVNEVNILPGARSAQAAGAEAGPAVTWIMTEETPRNGRASSLAGRRAIG
jgi:hypothetical protein